MNSLTAIAADIRREHEAAHRKAVEAVQHAKRAGELLIEAKKQISHGGWLPWLSSHCSVSARQAQKYMRLAEHWPELESKNEPGAHLTLSDALAALADPDDGTRLVRRLEALADALRDEKADDEPISARMAALKDDAAAFIADASDAHAIARIIDAAREAEQAAVARCLTATRRASELLAESEGKIAEFDRVCHALTAIRDQRLYRETHATFEDYCRDKWGLGADALALYVPDVDGAQP